MGSIISNLCDRPPSLMAKTIESHPSPLIDDEIDTDIPDINDRFFIFVPHEQKIDSDLQTLEHRGLNINTIDKFQSLTKELQTIYDKYMSILKEKPDDSTDASGSTTINELSPKRSLKLPSTEPTLIRRSSVEDTSHGKLVLEVESAKFLQPKYLNQYGLTKPFVQVSIIYDNERSYKFSVENIKERGQNITKFETKPDEKEAFEPAWNQLIQYAMNYGKPLKHFYIVISLIYRYDNDTRTVCVGEELFSMSALLSQQYLVKVIDFRSEQYKGILARLRIRIQLITDFELLLERTLIDINTKIERLDKIKKKARSSYKQAIAKNGGNQYYGEFSDLELLKYKSSESDYNNVDEEQQYYIK